MSRITLKTYDNGEQHLVVGWDHPVNSYFWQEFNKEPAPEPDGHVDWSKHEDWVEMAGYGGYMPGELPSIKALLASAPPQITTRVTLAVMEELERHKADPNSGRTNVDMSGAV